MLRVQIYGIISGFTGITNLFFSRIMAAVPAGTVFVPLGTGLPGTHVYIPLPDGKRKMKGKNPGFGAPGFFFYGRCIGGLIPFVCGEVKGFRFFNEKTG
jgi:hypothetical protein